MFQLKTKLYEATVGMVNKAGKQFEEYLSSWSSAEAKFLAKGMRLPKKLDLWRILLAKGVAMLVAMTFFHPCLKFFIIEVLAIV